MKDKRKKLELSKLDIKSFIFYTSSDMYRVTLLESCPTGAIQCPVTENCTLYCG